MQDLYLKLFHGRDSPNQDMDDWGFEGPTIGPLSFVHTTYATDIKVCFANEETERKFFPNNTLSYPDSVTFPVVEACIEFNGKFYGDWSVTILKPKGDK